MNIQDNNIISDPITKLEICVMLLTETNRTIINNMMFLEHISMIDERFMEYLVDLWDKSEKIYNETEIRLLILDKKIKSKFNKMIYHYTNGGNYFENQEEVYNEPFDDEDEIGGLATILLTTKLMLIKEIKIYHIYIFELLTKLSFIKHQIIKIEVLLKKEHNNLFDRVFVILLEQFKMDYLDTNNKICKYEKKFKAFHYILNDKFSNPDVYNVIEMHYN